MNLWWQFRVVEHSWKWILEQILTRKRQDCYRENSLDNDRSELGPSDLHILQLHSSFPVIFSFSTQWKTLCEKRILIPGKINVCKKNEKKNNDNNNNNKT